MKDKMIFTDAKVKKICNGLQRLSENDVEKRFKGTCKDIAEVLNKFDYKQQELFFTGFFCDNLILDMAAGELPDLEDLTSREKVCLFIDRGKLLCDLLGKEYGFIHSSPYAEKMMG